jgi:predicted nucleic-acid-binding Zn-ribbon protein
MCSRGAGLAENRLDNKLSMASVGSTSIMKSTGKCPKCGSVEIIADAKAIDRDARGWHSERFTVASFGNPSAFIFKDKRTTTISAWVCGQCGYVELYADSPSSLKGFPVDVD